MKLLLACLAILVATTGQVRAGVIGVGDFGGGATTVTYDDLPPGELVAAPLVFQGDTYTSNDGLLRKLSAGGSGTGFSGKMLTNNTSFGFIDIVLGSAVQQAGAWVSGVSGRGNDLRVVDVDFFDESDSLLGTVTFSGPDNGFVGWQADTGLIKRIRFTDTEPTAVVLAIDNLMKENNSQVPEPTSLAIFGFGALGLAGGAIRRRKKQTA